MADPNNLSHIDHLVVLMLENRSFDHMLGYLYGKSSTFAGLDGTEWNPDPQGNRVAVFPITSDKENAYWYPLLNPSEGYQETNQQLFGSADAPQPPTATNTGFVTSFAGEIAHPAHPTDPKLNGLSVSSIMGMYTPEMLPVLSGLAKGYAVSDGWFASVPTQTYPNRAFALAGTSLGRVLDKEGSQFDTPSIFGAISKVGATWKIYGYSGVPLTAADFPETRDPTQKGNLGTFKTFTDDAKLGNLPSFAFLEPEWADYKDPTRHQENDQHPVSSLANGEQLIYDVYQALRAGPNWARTLLIITYDEHGGIFDHVPPPTTATPPDDKVGPSGFDFSRFGVRVPAVLVSPLIAPGTVLNPPAAGPPFDHTSILATIRARWGAGPLGKRDAAAPDVSSVLTLAAARNDDPLDGVQPPAYVAPTGPGADSVGVNPSAFVEGHALTAAKLPIPGATIAEPEAATARLRTAADHMLFIQDRLRRWYGIERP
jgi:phospholipase C